MDISIVNSATITTFLSYAPAFSDGVDGLFSRLDADHDGLLSRDELATCFRSCFMLSPFPSEAFAMFDRNGTGAVDRLDFRIGVEKVMRAIADGIGGTPVGILVADECFLTRAVEHERTTVGRRHDVNGIKNRGLSRFFCGLSLSNKRVSSSSHGASSRHRFHAKS